MKALYVTSGVRPGDKPREILIDVEYEFGPGPWTSANPDGEREHVRKAVLKLAEAVYSPGGIIRFEDECSRCLLIEQQCECETIRGRRAHFGHDFAIIECVERSSGRTGRVDLGGRFNFICDEDIHHREETRENIEVTFEIMWGEKVAVRFGDEPHVGKLLELLPLRPEPDPPAEGKAQ